MTPTTFADLPELALAPDMLTLAAQILGSKVANFDPKTFHDRYEEALGERFRYVGASRRVPLHPRAIRAQMKPGL